VIEDRALGTREYCTSDVSSDPLAAHVFLALEPIDDPAATLTAFATEDTAGIRYPTGVAQARQVMDEAGNGRFAAASLVGVDHVAGKLFVPQHSGLQPLPQEKSALRFSDPAAPALPGCNQQLATLDTAAAGFPAPVIDAVGAKVAAFPIAPTTNADGAGCPNPFIVDQGKNRDNALFTPFPNLPMFTFFVDYPPQLTGFQTNNGVISPVHVESTLFNLVYNSNAVFIELYETAIWQIGRSRGTGQTALALSDPLAHIADPAAPDRLTSSACAAAMPATCYTKNLAEWGEELHLRRLTAAAHAATFLGDRFRGYDFPFPVLHRQRFVNTTGQDELHAYINPGHCDPALVDLVAGNGVPGALAVVTVHP
jgi:hypothetical protein